MLPATLITVAVKIAFVCCIAKDPPIQTRIDKMRLVRKIPDEELMVDIKTFVHDHYEDEPQYKKKPALRLEPKYFEADNKDCKNKTLDLMKQAIYGTQMRLRDLDATVEKYRNNMALRMAFLFGRLDQLMVDIRRILTLALKTQYKEKEKLKRRKVIEHILLYQWTTRKHVDIIYLVEYIIKVHTEFMNLKNGQDKDYY